MTKIRYTTESGATYTHDVDRGLWHYEHPPNPYGQVFRAAAYFGDPAKIVDWPYKDETGWTRKPEIGRRIYITTISGDWRLSTPIAKIEEL